MLKIILPLALLALAAPCQAASSLMNPSAAEPDTIINYDDFIYLLPDGSPVIIERLLPDKSAVTDSGIKISPEGLIRDGRYKGKKIIQTHESPAPRGEPAPEVIKLPEGVRLDIPGLDDEPFESRLTIADMLPKTELPKDPKSAGKNEDFYIPPEAAQGNLGFLEGCWKWNRNTWIESPPSPRMEYPIEECFCFSKGAKKGRRLIKDPRNGRCRGSSRASASKNGVLSINNSPAQCTKDFIFAPVSITCRNKGQRAECSYNYDKKSWNWRKTLTFKRVNSCK